jgi:hypothetical protein
MRSNLRRAISAALLITTTSAGLVLAAAGPASAATIPVTTTDDVVDAGDGLISLREAVAQASSNGEDDVVQLGVGATYQLDLCAEGDLELTGSNLLTVEGNGSTIEQTCDDQRIFNLLGTSDLAIEDLTLTGAAPSSGGTGSAIRTQGAQSDVTITRSHLVANGGRAVQALGVVVVEDSTFVDNDELGALEAPFGADVSGSSFEGNGSAMADGGGAVVSLFGLLEVTDSAFVDNVVSGSGGALSAFQADIVVSSSTFTGNVANNGGAIAVSDSAASITLVNDTFVGNEAGVTTVGGNGAHIQTPNVAFSSTGSVFAEPLGERTSCNIGSVPLVTSGGGNYEADDDSCGLAGGTDVQDGTDPLLDDLTGTGAGAALVPEPGSPLIDLLPAADCDELTDQRGTTRPLDGDWDGVAGCDAGAIERDPGRPFSDVGPTHPFFTEIGWMAYEGISTGSLPGPTYKPADAVSRQAMSAFLYRLAGEPAFTPPVTPTFTDVATSNPFFLEVEWMNAEGITTGFGGGLFKPSAAVSRQSMSAFMFRMAGEPLGPFPNPGFTDVSSSHPFFEEISWMADAGVTTGFPGPPLTYRPAQPVSRQAMAAFMQRLAPLLP